MPANLALWVYVAELVLKHGFPAVREIVETWNADMSEDEIRVKITEYQNKLKKPEEYFE